MTRIRLAAAVVLALAAAPALAEDSAVKIFKKEGVGAYLADGKDMTLYTFKNDMKGMSHCEGACIEKWPPFYRAKVEAKDGLKAADFGTIQRADGRKQTTYKGLPLYYFSGDKGPADTVGHGFRDLWTAAAP